MQSSIRISAFIRSEKSSSSGFFVGEGFLLTFLTLNFLGSPFGGSCSADSYCCWTTLIGLPVSKPMIGFVFVAPIGSSAGSTFGRDFFVSSAF